MRKIHFVLLFLIAAIKIQAQVGVGTVNPTGTFNVDGAKDNATTGTPTNDQQANDFIVTSTGLVGIGKLIPKAILDINSTSGQIVNTRYSTTANAGPGLILRKSNAANNLDNGALLSGDLIGRIAFFANTGSGYSTIANSEMRSEQVGTSSSTNVGSKIIFATATQNTTSLTDRMVILDNGKVGIGIVNPLNMLVVRGVNAQPSAQNLDQTNATFRVDSNTNHALDFGTLNDTPFGAYIQSQNKTAANGLALSLNPSGGKVGIGLVSPSYDLDVNGTARIATVPTIATATKMLVKDPSTGQISEQTISGGTTPSTVVYVNAATPATATIFDTANPAVTNNNAFKNLTTAIYVGTDGSQWTSDGTVYSTYAPSFQGASDEFTATASQTVFTLSGLPKGKVWFFRNGSRLTNNCYTVVGSKVTYIPANNGGASLGTIVAGDIITIDYVK